MYEKGLLAYIAKILIFFIFYQNSFFMSTYVIKGSPLTLALLYMEFLLKKSTNTIQYSLTSFTLVTIVILIICVSVTCCKLYVWFCLRKDTLNT